MIITQESCVSGSKHMERDSDDLGKLHCPWVSFLFFKCWFAHFKKMKPNHPEETEGLGVGTVAAQPWGSEADQGWELVMGLKVRKLQRFGFSPRVFLVFFAFLYKCFSSYGKVFGTYCLPNIEATPNKWACCPLYPTNPTAFWGHVNHFLHTPKWTPTTPVRSS